MLSIIPRQGLEPCYLPPTALRFARPNGCTVVSRYMGLRSSVIPRLGGLHGTLSRFAFAFRFRSSANTRRCARPDVPSQPHREPTDYELTLTPGIRLERTCCHLPGWDRHNQRPQSVGPPCVIHVMLYFSPINP